MSDFSCMGIRETNFVVKDTVGVLSIPGIAMNEYLLFIEIM